MDAHEIKTRKTLEIVQNSLQIKMFYIKLGAERTVVDIHDRTSN